MQNKSLRRLLSGILAAAVAVNGLIVATPANDIADNSSVDFSKVSNSSVSAAFPGRDKFVENEETSPYADSDVVRVSIVLKDKSTIGAGYEVKDIAENAAAMNYRAELQRKQNDLVADIEKVIDDELDVVWNLTLAANIISANVEYGQIEAIEALPDVEQVVIETQYFPDVLKQPIATDPNMATSSKQIGSNLAWAAGYTGAGSRIAIIDTGADDQHQSFDGDALMYSLEQLAEESDDPDFIKNLNLLTKEEIEKAKDDLNIGHYRLDNNDKEVEGEAVVDPDKAYLNAKIPFAYNYIDRNYDTDHKSDGQGNHGSHVAGISTANKYIANGDGTYTEALDSVFVQGVAPDAQLLVMKVFGNRDRGGAYDADYMAAIEDAIVLKADSINLSLGSGNPGMSRHSDKIYQDIMDSLAESGVVVAMSAGNAYSWPEYSNTLAGSLYADDVSLQMDGTPGSYTNSLTVASINNSGAVGNYFTVNGQNIVYTETSGYSNKSFATLAGEGELEYVFIDGLGTKEDWAAIGNELEGKVAVCQRGTINFYQKAEFAVDEGAIAVIIYNNQGGNIGSMDLSDYSYDTPIIGITQEDGKLMKAAATPVAAAANIEDEDVDVLPEGENTPAQAEDEAAPEDENEEASEADEDENVPEADENEEAPEVTEDENVPEADESEEAPEADENEAAEENAEAPQADEAPAYYVGKITYVSEEAGVSDGTPEYYTMSDFSSWGVPGSLQLKPEITAPGGNIYSVFGESAADGNGPNEYDNMSGTSMASPQIAGMAAVAAQYVREKKLDEKTGLSARVLIQSLLMSTAEPVMEDLGEDGESYYSLLKQGAGLANINNVVTADSYILMGDNATVSAKDGKVKAELGDDPDRTGEYSFSFSVNNLTDTEKTYKLDSSFFVQYPFRYYTNEDGATGFYMDLSTDPISTKATFSCGDKVTVAANGSANVTVTVKLDASDVAYIEECYENGTYIEGFVFAEAETSADGAKGTVHSIPVLGFYGNWSDASMFDVGSQIEYRHGEEVRDPYLGRTTANAFAIVDADDSKNTYYFGGNPYITDETYMPERNSINAEDKISIVNFAVIRNAADSKFTAYDETADKVLLEIEIGAVSSAYYYVNGQSWQNTGYNIKPNFTPSGAAEGDKLNMALTLALEYYQDNEGNIAWDKLGKGASLSVPAVVDNTAPVIKDVEIDEENNVLKITASDNRYVALVALYTKSGELLGYAKAKQSIEEGAEAVYEISLEDVQGKKFLVQACDYAMNESTYEIREQIGDDVPVADMMGFNLFENFWISLSKESTAEDVEVSIADTDLVFTAATIKDHTVYATTETGMLCFMPEYDLTDVTVIKYQAEDISAVTFDATASEVKEILGGTNFGFADMAYNPADGKIYGLWLGGLYTVEELTGELEYLGDIPFEDDGYTNTLACDENGTFYSNEMGTADVYSFTVESGEISSTELVATADLPGGTRYMQAMEINPNNGILCWTSLVEPDTYYGYYVEIDPETGDATVYNDLETEISALIIPVKGDEEEAMKYDFNGDGFVDERDGQALLDYRTGVRSSIYNEEYADFDGNEVVDSYDAYLFLTSLNILPVSKVSGVTVSDFEIEIVRANTYKLDAAVQPWTAKDRSVTWTTSDPTVATVAKDGTVTAVGKGECTITATANADSSLTATCAVTVTTVPVVLTGVLQDENGKPQIFNWDMDDTTWSSVRSIKPSITAAAYDGYYDVMYILDEDWNMNVVDFATGETIADASGAGIPYWDLTSSKLVDMVYGVFGPYMFADDPMALTDSAWNDRGYLSTLGSSMYVALVNVGAFQTSATTYAELIMALDDQGVLWVWRFNLNAVTGSVTKQLYNLYRIDNIEEAYPGHGNDMYCSLIMDDDGHYLYLSAFNGETNNIYRIALYNNGTGEATFLGDVGQDVWPAVLLTAEPTAVGAMEAPSMFTSSDRNTEISYLQPDLMTKYADELAEAINGVELEGDFDLSVVKPIEETSLASFGRTFGASESDDDTESDDSTEYEIKTDVDVKEIDKDTETFTVKLGVANSGDEPSTNGIAVVTYDPAVLELVSVDIDADYTSANIIAEEGVAILGYVSPEEAIPAGTLFETLTFKVKDIENADGSMINIGVAELGNGGTAEEPNHSNLLIEYSTPLSARSGNADTAAEIMEDILPSTGIKVEVSEEPVPDQPDEPVVTIPSNGNFIDPYAPGGALAPETTEPGETTAPSESNDPSGNDPAGSEPANNDPASSDPAGSDPSGNEVSTGTNAPESGDGNGNAGNAGDVNAPNDEDKNQYTGVSLFIAPAAISALAVLVTKKHRR